MKNLTLLFAFILLVLTACNSKEADTSKNQSHLNKLNNSTIIDEELDVSFNAPLDWKEMNTALSEKMVARIKKRGEDEFIVYSPKLFFFEDSTNSLLRVGEVNLKDNTNAESLSIKQYSKLFRKYNREFTIESEKLQSNNMDILQMKLTRNKLISFKYLFKNHTGKIIQFDFSIKKENLESLYPQIMASVKSIKLL
jgi:hypothetical protein